MGYIYIVEFKSKTKYGISIQDPLKRIKTHQADLRKLDLDDTIIHMSIHHTLKFKEIENQLKFFYKTEWVNETHDTLYQYIMPYMKNSDDKSLDNKSQNNNQTEYDPLSFLELHGNRLYKDCESYKFKKLYNLYDDQCIIDDMLPIDYESFKLIIRKSILRNELENYTVSDDIVSYKSTNLINQFFEDMNVPFINIDVNKTTTQNRKTSIKKLEKLFADWNTDETYKSFKSDLKAIINKSYVQMDNSSNLYFMVDFYKLRS